MLERLSFGALPRKAHTALRGPKRALRYEECITRAGFDGPYTIVYHEQRPHEAEPISVAHGWEIADGRARPARGLMRHHFRSFEQRQRGGPPLEARVPLLENDDLVLSVLAPNEEDSAYFVNADGDELLFIREGGGVLKTQLGELRFQANDYLCLPRGLLHRFVPDATLTQDWLSIESAGPIAIPRQYRNDIGQLRMDAPYSHRDFRALVERAERGRDPQVGREARRGVLRLSLPAFTAGCRGLGRHVLPRRVLDLGFSGQGGDGAFTAQYACHLRVAGRARVQLRAAALGLSPGSRRLPVSAFVGRYR